MEKSLKEVKEAPIQFLDQELARLQSNDSRRGVTYWAISLLLPVQAGRRSHCMACPVC